ncbi:MAG: DUF429 domain-containing protein [Caldisphaeraceae archaeon]|nr:DUF429 domain-containing protein [Caldisphaeraceae archaeon]MEB3691578.1 DUF429 domain-containing protein [Caldisphaeraceae archaeon]MEB3797704.1 DUF429 domain-containing protein [Caldisphaeraceae archaeon]
MIFLGIDLAASERHPSGVAIINSGLEVLYLGELYKDEEILEVITQFSPAIASIDAPLYAKDAGFRDVERIMMKSGFRFLPLSLKSMKELSRRGVKIAEVLRKNGIKVIETHPTSCIKYLGLSFEELLRDVGIILNKKVSSHEKDSLISALVSIAFYLGESRCFSGQEGTICIIEKGFIYKLVKNIK